jgi:hypothetical protein
VCLLLGQINPVINLWSMWKGRVETDANREEERTHPLIDFVTNASKGNRELTSSGDIHTEVEP